MGAKKTVISEQGKEAVVALLDAGDFFSEACLAGEAPLSTVSALTKCTIARISKADTTRVIHEEPMTGTTRSRVSFFMNKFPKLGIDRLQRQH